MRVDRSEHGAYDIQSAVRRLKQSEAVRIPCPSSLQRILDISTAWCLRLITDSLNFSRSVQTWNESRTPPSPASALPLSRFAVVAWSDGFGKAKTLVTEGAREVKVVVPQASRAFFQALSMSAPHGTALSLAYSHGDALTPTFQDTPHRESCRRRCRLRAL